jgi:hypothetical protein
MVVPLQTAASGSLSAVDTTSITSGEVVEELRKNEDRNIEQRQQMVELKEREADEAGQRAAIQREEAARETEQAAELRRQAETERQSIAEERRQVPEGTAPEEEASRQAALDEREANIAVRESEADKLEASAGEKERQADANEEFADRKMEEAGAERAAISEDQRELIAAANVRPEGGAPAGLIGIRLIDSDSPLGAPVLIDPSSGDALKTSALSAVRARSHVKANGKNIAISGESDGDSVHRLVEIDGETLQTVRQGADEINRESLIWVNGADLYSIVIGPDGQNYLARFNTDLAKQAQSLTAIHRFASLRFEGSVVITQDAGGGVITLDAQSLR